MVNLNNSYNNPFATQTGYTGNPILDSSMLYAPGGIMDLVTGKLDTQLGYVSQSSSFNVAQLGVGSFYNAPLPAGPNQQLSAYGLGATQSPYSTDFLQNTMGIISGGGNGYANFIPQPASPYGNAGVNPQMILQQLSQLSLEQQIQALQNPQVRSVAKQYFNQQLTQVQPYSQEFQVIQSKLNFLNQMDSQQNGGLLSGYSDNTGSFGYYPQQNQTYSPYSGSFGGPNMEVLSQLFSMSEDEWAQVAADPQAQQDVAQYLMDSLSTLDPQDPRAIAIQQRLEILIGGSQQSGFDPFGQLGGGFDPFGQGNGSDPFGQLGGGFDPFGQTGGFDPFGQLGGGNVQPSYGTPAVDPAFQQLQQHVGGLTGMMQKMMVMMFGMLQLFAGNNGEATA